MAWFVKTTLGNMTQTTKHAFFKDALATLKTFEAQYEKNPSDNMEIAIQFRTGPQARIAAKQAKDQ